MNRATVGTILMACAGWLALGQSPEALPKFEAADVHVSAKSANQYLRTPPVVGDRYELKTANMVDLIRTAYGFDADKVVGGPNWVEMDRFDVIAKLPADSTPETRSLMLQALLEDRFKLVAHKETKPLPAYVLSAGKKPQIKEAAGSGETGCKVQSDSGAPAESGSTTIMMGNPDGTATRVSLGPGMTIRYLCRNMTMEAFAAGMPAMMFMPLGSKRAVDQTGLKGKWDFEIRYSAQLFGAPMANSGDRISIVDAVDKQLGLKLEE